MNRAPSYHQWPNNWHRRTPRERKRNSRLWAARGTLDNVQEVPRMLCDRIVRPFRPYAHLCPRSAPRLVTRQ